MYKDQTGIFIGIYTIQQSQMEQHKRTSTKGMEDSWSPIFHNQCLVRPVSLDHCAIASLAIDSKRSKKRVD
jgi:hypothetical protein